MSADLGRFDVSLNGALSTSRRKIEYQIGKIGRKTASQIMARDEQAAADAQQLSGLVFPEKHLQERLYSIVPFLAKFGPGLIGEIYGQVDTGESGSSDADRLAEVSNGVFHLFRDRRCVVSRWPQRSAELHTRAAWRWEFRILMQHAIEASQPHWHHRDSQPRCQHSHARLEVADLTGFRSLAFREDEDRVAVGDKRALRNAELRARPLHAAVAGRY